MSTMNKNEEPSNEEKRNKMYKLTKPLRSITFPMGCLIFCVVYWLILIPILYHILLAECAGTCSKEWRFYFWAFTSIIFIAILGIVVCWRGCHPPKDKNKVKKAALNKEKQQENDKLLSNQVKYNNLKNQNITGLSIKNEKRSPSKEKEKVDQSNFNTTNESKIEKETVTLPSKTIFFKGTERKSTDNDDKASENLQSTAPKEGTMMEEIDKIFPRCSTRRKIEPKKRPDTLIIHSPKYPKEEHDKRYSFQEQSKRQSPLTPREMFFYDLIQGARRQTIERTDDFLDYERKHWFDGSPRPSKPEVKAFVLKERTDTEPSSPEYFIASVPNRRSCTAEAFLFVDGGQTKEELTICYIDRDDDVFKKD